MPPLTIPTGGAGDVDFDDTEYTWPPVGHALPDAPPHTLEEEIGGLYAQLERRVAALEAKAQALASLVHRLMNGTVGAAVGDGGAEEEDFF